MGGEWASLTSPIPIAGKILYVVPEAGWSTDWAGYYITRWIQKLGIKGHLYNKPPRVKGDIIHYADTQSLLNHIENPANDHNWLVATIPFGDNTEEFPDMEHVVLHMEDLNRIVVNNELMHQRFLDWGLREDKLVCVPLGVDLNSFFPASDEEREELRMRFAVPEGAFCVGSFQKDGIGWDDGEEPFLAKGPDVFLDAMDRLSAKISNLHVFLTGPARGYVKRGLDQLGISYCHHWVEKYQEIRDCYACLDAYVISGREDAGPNTLLESMACGVPVVSTPVGMSADVIEDDLNGRMCELEDYDGLADALYSISEDKDLSMKLTMMGIDTAREYDWSTITAVYFEHVYAPLMVQRYT